VIQVVVAALAPLAPLLLTMMPLAELAQKLFGMLFEAAAGASAGATALSFQKLFT
jgi:hypothetical protein